MAREQAKEIYKLTQSGSYAKDFDLKNQVNASAGSVMDNIAEGFERFSNRDFSKFLVIAKGSHGEVRLQLHRSFGRAHISEEILKSRLDFSTMLGNKINSFINYLKSSQYKNKPLRRDEHPTSNFQLPT